MSACDRHTRATERRQHGRGRERRLLAAHGRQRLKRPPWRSRGPWPAAAGLPKRRRSVSFFFPSRGKLALPFHGGRRKMSFPRPSDIRAKLRVISEIFNRPNRVLFYRRGRRLIGPGTGRFQFPVVIARHWTSTAETVRRRQRFIWRFGQKIFTAPSGLKNK